MKKILVLMLALAVIVSGVFAACSNKNGEEDYSESGLEDSNNEFGFEFQEVTDENGETVTDENGNPVTTQVAVVYETDKNGNTYAIPLDADGNPQEDKKFLVSSGSSGNSNNNKDDSDEDESGNNTTTTAPKTTGTTKKDVPYTESPGTTEFEGDDTVPKTSATGKQVNFSVNDQNIIKSMLEVPYLYLANYENSDGVPMEIAVHTAVWMAERDGSSRNVYPASPVVLNLFKYYGQTVINFKDNCNTSANKADAPIEYKKSNDTFVISNYTPKVQSVTIKKIEDLGNNNYYKVTASVTGCNKKQVIAIIQKNRLDSSLGFSIKALKWS